MVHYLRPCVYLDTLETFAAGANVLKKSEEDSPLYYFRTEATQRAFRDLRKNPLFFRFALRKSRTIASRF